MSLAAQVIDGQVTSQITKTTETGNTKTEKSGTLDKDAFLQLLVAQMKYQDPMEPTDNTEYVSQLASFSELEQMQNLTTSMDTQRASSLVGQYVTVKSKSEATGEISLIGGKVDYVAIEGGKAFLSINGGKYSIDDLDSIVDNDYLNAYTLANDFATSLAKLPTLSNLTTGYKDVIENLRKVYSDMTDYQKTFVTPSQLSTLSQYETKLSALLADENNAQASEDETEEKEVSETE